MRIRRSLFRWALKKIPRKKHLHGGLLHKIVGDRLFDPRIWSFSIPSVSGGLALGTFVALTPTFPFQMMIAGVLAYIFKVNVPLALSACWITNPLTMPIVYPLEYKLGEIISEFFNLPNIYDFAQPTQEARQVVEQMDLPKGQGFFKSSMPVVINMFVGSTVTATISSILVYFGVYFSLSSFKNQLKKLDKHINHSQ